MKKLFLVILLASAAAAAAAQVKPTILITPVFSEVLDETERRLVLDAVIDLIMASEEVVVVSEESRAIALAEIERSLTGLFAESAALDAGKLAEADYVLYLSIGRIGTGRVWAALRFIDVQSGELARAGSREYSDLEDMPKRIRDLVSKTLSMDPKAKPELESGEMIFIPVSSHRVFQGFSFGACFFKEYTENERIIQTSGLAAGLYQIYGRPFGFYLNANFFYLLDLSVNDQRQDWLGSLGLPWGVNLHIGPSLRLPIGETASCDLRAGLGFTQFQHYRAWETGPVGSNPVFNRESGSFLPPVIWTYGAFMGLSFNIRISRDIYIVIGADASYEFGEFLPDMDPDKSPKRAWSITPILSLVQGK